MRAPLWVTILAGALALVLIVYGIVLLGSSVRFWQESGSLRMDINTAGEATLSTDLLAAPTPPPLLSGVESGSMVLGGRQEVVAFSAAAPAAAPAEVPAEVPAVPADVPLPTEAAPLPTVPPPPSPSPLPSPLPTVDPCAPQAEGGFAADAPLAAIGMVRLYTEPDVLSLTLGEFSAGQSFLVTADTAGVTAIRRCELVWVRVRLTGGGMGWALAGALQVTPATTVPALVPVAPPPICPGGCATPVCVQPCAGPCAQPCNEPCNSPCTQPCTTPCGVYSQ